jgi:hypothetical protein
MLLVTTTDQIIALLVAERDRLNRAIDALQGPSKPRGRPPKNPVLGGISAGSGSQKRRGRTAAQRAAQAEKMRAYWAKRRKESGKS